MPNLTQMPEPGARVQPCEATEPRRVQSIVQAGDVLAGSTQSWGEASTFLLDPRVSL